jgi:hypothetical protein
MDEPGSPVRQAVDAAANVITAAVVRESGGLPARVCRPAGVAKASSAR